MVTGFAICESGDPVGTQVVTNTASGPQPIGTSTEATAVCPTGTTVVGGGVLTNFETESVHPIGSFPSNAAGVPAMSGTTDPDAWSAVGEAGGGSNTDATTTAYAVCLDDPTLDTQVVSAVDVDHPAGTGPTGSPPRT